MNTKKHKPIERKKMEKEASTQNVKKIYFKKNNFIDHDGKIIKKIDHVTTTAFLSDSKDVLINAIGNEKQIIENFIKNHLQYQEANAYLVGSNMEHKDGGAITIPVTFYTIIRRKKK